MDEARKHLVSLRGASAKEISRDALLEKLSKEREYRSHARRATAASVFVQRVWRRYIARKKAAVGFRQEWEKMLSCHDGLVTASWISVCVLRPFLFFSDCLVVRSRKVSAREWDCIRKCFNIVLDSISSTDSMKNFCSLALGTVDERKRWTCQAHKLISLCCCILSECGKPHSGGQDDVVITSLAMRLLVVLTDLKGWRSVTLNSIAEANAVVKHLIYFMGSRRCGLYISIRRYMDKKDIPSQSQAKNMPPTDDKFLITASAMTLALRPLQATKLSCNDVDREEMQSATVQYCIYLLTIPWLSQRVPPVLLPALKHKTILSPCFQSLVILRDHIMKEMSELDQLKILHSSSKAIPPVGWALANIICLAAGNENDFVDPGGIDQGLYYTSYVRTLIVLAEKLLPQLENGEWNDGENQFSQTTSNSNMFFVDLLKPVCQQWHLTKLLAITNSKSFVQEDEVSLEKSFKYLRKLELMDLVCLYSYFLRMFFLLVNPVLGPLPVLNLLSFSPGFLLTLWKALESLLCLCDKHASGDNSPNRSLGDKIEKKQKHNKDGSKWVNVLSKITGKSQTGADNVKSPHAQTNMSVDKNLHDVWDIEPLRSGPQKLSKDVSCLLHLFCASYSHLLLVLDDIEFYEKQVPFTLDQQRRIASVLNTFVYNGVAQTTGQQNRPLMDSAVRCLHLIYERDCRHQFCPQDLWLSPARKNRPPIALAARTHQNLLANVNKSDDTLNISALGSVITATPHVYPFEERVQMLREFINMDKVSRRMAGEAARPGLHGVEIVVRRGHIVEDGFRQLNSLGSRLKSSINVSFVNDSGLPEAGLDYGGLSKEFLTDISKAIFSPDYGLFSQTSTSERLLIPNPTARYLDNGIQMIEFLGRIVGKALYEGILLDYSFSLVFVQKLLGRYSFIDELSTLDPELYRNLMYVKHYEGDIKDLSLDFTVTEESFGKHHVIELKPGGKDICVTNENKMQYVHAMADYKLNRQVLPFSNAFYRGLTDIISPSWLKLFNASEFNQLLSGGDLDIDIDDLRNHTKYTGGYSEGSRTIKLFWEVVKGFEPKERCMLLKFVTSCSRAPLLGFKHLLPSFTIHKVTCDSSIWASIGGQDVDRLPSASTCYNTLKLPTYKRASTLRAKLLYAISSNTGFELS